MSYIFHRSAGSLCYNGKHVILYYTMIKSLQLSILNGAYNGLGQSAGSLVGGYLSKHMGIRDAFILAGAINVLLLGGYLVGSYSPYLFSELLSFATDDSADTDPIKDV